MHGLDSVYLRTDFNSVEKMNSDLNTKRLKAYALQLDEIESLGFGMSFICKIYQKTCPIGCLSYLLTLHWSLNMVLPSE